MAQNTAIRATLKQQLPAPDPVPEEGVVARHDRSRPQQSAFGGAGHGRGSCTFGRGWPGAERSRGRGSPVVSRRSSVVSEDVAWAGSPATASGLTVAEVADDVALGRRDAGATLEGRDAGVAHRPFKIVYATLYYDVRPTFVVDITDQFETRLDALMAYKSQFTDQEAGSGIFPAQAEIRARVEAMARFYGMLAGVTYAEPFLQKEVGLVDDLTLIPVKSI